MYTTASVKPQKVFLVHKNKSVFPKPENPTSSWPKGTRLPFTITAHKYIDVFLPLKERERRVVVNLQGEDRAQERETEGHRAVVGCR